MHIGVPEWVRIWSRIPQQQGNPLCHIPPPKPAHRIPMPQLQSATADNPKSRLGAGYQFSSGRVERINHRANRGRELLEVVSRPQRKKKQRRIFSTREHELGVGVDGTLDEEDLRGGSGTPPRPTGRIPASNAGDLPRSKATTGECRVVNMV
ncbi:hypothetical protein FA13DRAFT_1719013 [Coprinellus micaceus]|uniref:Uncharacterized protein n=1 Tax=Coprinellus micaceus TaxID=71717 RepID=A0A4Y7SCR6_COPMI|nr:hypothetical protein FA13DRAFT_1719013 [Coprinellus micaceus]